MSMARLQQLFREKISAELTAKFGYTSPMQVASHHQDHPEHGCI